MKVKLLRDWRGNASGKVVELDRAMGAALVDRGIARVATPADIVELSLGMEEIKPESTRLSKSPRIVRKGARRDH